MWEKVRRCFEEMLLVVAGALSIVEGHKMDNFFLLLLFVTLGIFLIRFAESKYGIFNKKKVR